MVTVNGLSPALVPNSSKASQKGALAREQDAGQGAQATKVAQAVSRSVRHVAESDFAKAQVQYDLPEGSSRKAMETYMDVHNQERREELGQLVGVDIYI